ncbi:MAG: heavy metal-associated domain-containing protein [Planctomycetota bacterium]
MKTVATLILIGFLMIIGCSESGTTADTAAKDIIEASISGMDCSGCASQVCAAVESVAGVAGSTANLEAGKLTIGLKDGVDTIAAMAEIEKIITGLSNGKYAMDNIEVITPEGGLMPDVEDPGQEHELSEDADQHDQHPLIPDTGRDS